MTLRRKLPVDRDRRGRSSLGGTTVAPALLVSPAPVPRAGGATVPSCDTATDSVDNVGGSFWSRMDALDSTGAKSGVNGGVNDGVLVSWSNSKSGRARAVGTSHKERSLGLDASVEEFGVCEVATLTPLATKAASRELDGRLGNEGRFGAAQTHRENER